MFEPGSAPTVPVGNGYFAAKTYHGIIPTISYNCKKKKKIGNAS